MRTRSRTAAATGLSHVARDAYLSWKGDLQDLLTPEQAENLAAAIIEIRQILTLLDYAPIVEENITIETTDFTDYTASGTAETNLFNAGYTKRASVPITGVLESMIPDLTFDTTTVDSSGVIIKDQYKSYDGGVCVYSNGVPENQIVILTAEIRKGVS